MLCEDKFVENDDPTARRMITAYIYARSNWWKWNFMVQGEFFMAAGKVTARGRELSASWKGGYGRNVGRRVVKIARGGKYYSMHHEERRISAYWRSSRRLMGVAYWGRCTKRRRPSTIFRGVRRRSLVRLHRRRFSRLIEDFFFMINGESLS